MAATELEPKASTPASNVDLDYSLNTDDTIMNSDLLAEMLASASDVPPRPGVSDMASLANNGDSDLEVGLSALLDGILGTRTIKFNGGVPDLFAELQATLASGEVPFSTPLAPIREEHEVFDDSTPDFGIEIPGA